MRWLLLVLAVLALASGWAVGNRIAAVQAAPSSPEASPFAVVELFTSEGCSSCPPADQLLGELASEFARRPVITLSFHVDYWNNLGWRDPYSDAGHSARQRRYASELSDGRVYTPQAVVNGRWETIGSRAGPLRALIARALAEPSNGAPEVGLSLVRDQSATLTVTSRVTGAPRGAQLSIVLVQPHARSKVSRGENANLTLDHHNVVRAVVPSLAGPTTLQLPHDLQHAPVAVVALLRDGSSSRILAASYRASE